MTEPKKKSIKKVLADLAQQDPEKHNQRLARGYGIGEPVVEVPVSQLAQWNDDLRALLPVGTYAILNELADLLSQPTPSAEPHAEACALNLARFRRDDGAPCTCRTEPPLIEDMAPGTTFRIDREEVWTVIENRVAICDLYQVGRYLEEFNSSTIRDVTPPKEDSNG